MTKFVVILSNTNLQQQTVLHNLFAPRAHWWHWSEGVWLLAFQSESPTAAQLHHEILQALPGVNFMVIKIDGNEFAGWGPAEWHQWFNTCWK